jgi:ATP-dependent Zn protease
MTDSASGGKPMLEFSSRPKEADRKTRRPVPFWDRIKVLLFLLTVFGLFAWSHAITTEAPFREDLRDTVRSYWWLLLLAGLEVIRQFHYFLQEQSEVYYRFWARAFRGMHESTERVDPWTRFRVARVVRWLVYLYVLGLILAPLISNATGEKVGPIGALFQAPALFLSALPRLLQFAVIMLVAVGQFVAIFWFLSRGGIDTIMPDEIETRFDDVKGQDTVLQQVKETLIFLEDPKSIEERGGYVPGGILLWGPPGTGKTLIAKAVAGETGKPFVFVEPSAFINMFIGVGPLKVKSLYRKLRKLSGRYGGVIVFLDEADSLGSRGGAPVGAAFERALSPWSVDPGCNGVGYLTSSGRAAVFSDALRAGATDGFIMGGMGGGGGMGTLQALLSEMSGLEKPRGLVNRIRRALGMRPKPPPKYRILHIFATNMPDTLDPAMRRPGRIDREYKVGYPQKEGRRDTFEKYLGKVRNELTLDQIDELATITPYFSGAMIEFIVNEALVIAIRDGRDTVAYRDVIRAKQIKQHGLPDDHEYIERERHSVAVHEACHAVVAYRLRRHMTIDLATIERRGDVGGFVSSIPPEDRFVDWRSEHEVDVMASLASLAGERLFFEGDNSAGVGGDMRNATALTMMMEGYWAMGETMVAHSVNMGAMRGAQPLETGSDRNMWDGAFGRVVEGRMRELYDRTWSLLEENRGDVLAVAHALETYKTIAGDDVAAVIEGRQGPIVDGRPYHDPRFVEDLERYHAACVAAHKAHGDVEHVIPIPVPPAPEGSLAAAWPTTGNGQGGGGHMLMSPTDPPRPDTG